MAPDRVAARGGTARSYPVAAVREARITVALRAAGYRVPEVRAAIRAVRDLADVGASLAALDARLHAVTERTVALLRTGPVLIEMIESATTTGTGSLRS